MNRATAASTQALVTALLQVSNDCVDAAASAAADVLAVALSRCLSFLHAAPSER